MKEIEKLSYEEYVSEQRQTETSEHRREIVKKLLAKLPESERTVVTLYYLGEMKVKEISKFLGVSVSTIHTRLHRARKRLQEREEHLVKEVLVAYSYRRILRRTSCAKFRISNPYRLPVEATNSPLGNRHFEHCSRCNDAWRQQPILCAFPATL